MSTHYSTYLLNTYSAEPYFCAQIPAGYPVHETLQKCRAFRRLPPNIRQLASLSRQYAERVYGHDIENIDHWYDADGYELDPGTGKRLTDEEIDAEWDPLDLGLDDFVVKDIPVPPGGFADPATWEAPPPEPDLVDRDGLTREQVLSDVASRGFEATAREYGVPRTMLPAAGDAEGLAQVILGMHGQEWPPDEAAS